MDANIWLPGLPSPTLQPSQPRRWPLRRMSSLLPLLRSQTNSPSFQRSIIRLSILLLLFDVYLTWARIEKLSPPLPPSSHHPSTAPINSTQAPTNAALLSTQPLVLQYLFFLFLVTLSTLSFHIPIRLLCSHPPAIPSLSLPLSLRRLVPRFLRSLRPLVPYYPHPTPLSTALLVSSCTKLFPILLIIWEYDLPSSASAVSWAVIVNNIAALEILMDCGYVRAGFLVAVGASVRAVVAGMVLKAVGLAGSGGWRGELGLAGWGSWRGNFLWGGWWYCHFQSMCLMKWHCGECFIDFKFLLWNTCASPLQTPEEPFHAERSHVHQDLPNSHSYILSQSGQGVFLLFPIFCALIFSAPRCTFQPSTVPFLAFPPPSLRGLIL